MKGYRTEKEILVDNQVSLFKLEKDIMHEKYSIEEIGEILPGMLHLNRAEDLVLSYFNTWAENLFEKSVEEVVELGIEFMASIYEPETAILMQNSFARFVEKNDKSSVHGLFQNGHFNPRRKNEWMFTSSKLIENGDYLISYSSPIGNLENNSEFLLRNLEDNLFLRKNFRRFQSLTKREKEILHLVASGLTSKQIAEMLFLSKATISTHRKKIKHKLELRNINDWIRYSDTFNPENT